MKILRITVENLASLEGQHTVDFTRDPLRSTGLYSIIGPTGAGKSTLLDALCLSLYEDTPRLSAIRTKTEKLSEGETQRDPRTLLRRGAASGFAETAFVGMDGKTYTARWQVRRARNKVDGALQKSEMALYSENVTPGAEGVVIEGGKKTDVLNAIELRIGLTFSQFTRAVMLAQNDFAAFLKTDDKERAAILEALTGTEAFTRISRAVFKRCSEEEEKLKAIESQMQGYTPLSVEARADAEKQREEAKQSLHESQQQLARLKATLEWFTGLAKLDRELSEARAQYTRAVQLDHDAAPRKTQLQLSQRVLREAQPLRIPHQQANTTFKDAETALARRASEFLSAQTTLQETTTAFERAQAHATELEKDQIAARPQLDRARQLDAILPGLRQTLDQSQQGKTEAEEYEKTALSKLQTKTEELNRTKNRRTELQGLLNSERLKPAVPLAPQADSWLISLSQLEQDTKKHRVTASELQHKRQQLEELRPRIDDHNKQKSSLSERLEQAQQKLQLAIDAEQKIDVQALDRESLQLTESRNIVVDFGQQVKDYCHVQAALQTTIVELQQQREREAPLLKQIETDRNQPTQAEVALKTAQQMVDQIRAAIGDHAKRLRTLLLDNHPCPVCGSESHPWHQQEPDLNSVALTAAEQQVRQQQELLNNAITHWAKLETDVEHCRREIKRLEKSEIEAQQKLQNFVWNNSNAPNIAPLLLLPPQERLAAAEVTLQAIDSSLQHIHTQRTAAAERRKDTADCRTLAEEAERELRTLLDRIADLEKKEAGYQAALTQLEPREAIERGAIEEQTHKLNELWSAFPQSRTLFQSDPAKLRADLQDRFEQCQQSSEKLQTVNATIDSLNGVCSELEKTHARAAEQLTEATAAFKQASSNWEEKFRERQSLFEGRSVADVDAEFTRQLKDAVDQLTAAREAKTKAESNRSNAEQNQAAAAEALEAARQQLSTHTQHIENWLQEINRTLPEPLTIDRIDEILNRSPAWLQNEQREIEELRDRTLTTGNLVESSENRRTEHLATRPTELDEQAVQLRKQEQDATVAKEEERLKQAEAPLIIDDANRKKNEKLAQQLLQQSQLAAPWQKLNELVGSSDGTKFSRIAQSITLDLLLKDANYQLSQLAPRYRLERLVDSLNLVIIDREMGDERRSVHSLSGGESFLVSLALALGLAALTSNRMRIESLFIDEGFGSLDEDTLSLAMNALMQLEAQGRKVGIITHVTQMKDVIPVQIQVRRTKGGASAIQIPGT